MDGVHVSGLIMDYRDNGGRYVNGIVYIYFFYQYDHPLVLNVRESCIPVSLDRSACTSRRMCVTRLPAGTTKHGFLLLPQGGRISWPALLF
jgi:hypothetical protein